MNKAYYAAVAVSNDLEFLNKLQNDLFEENKAQLLWMNQPDYKCDDEYIAAHQKAVEENMRDINFIQKRIDEISNKTTNK